MFRALARLCPLCICLLVVSSGCTSLPIAADGLSAREHAALRRLEARIAASDSRLQDPTLQAYLEHLTQRLESPLVSSRPMRIYVLDRQPPQAELLGSEVLRVHLSLLLKLESEAELAFVLAHELAHRDLGHPRARRRPDWNTLDAEIRADRAAVDVLARVGYSREAGLSVLRRFAQQASDDATRDQLQARLRALSPIAAAEPSRPRSTDIETGTFTRLLAPYREREPGR